MKSNRRTLLKTGVRAIEYTCLIFNLALFRKTGLFVTPLDNGLALTPPMGWMSWLRFGCNYRCDLDPNNCISEKLFKSIGDSMVSEGYLAAGYNYLSIDDCWMAHTRDENNNLMADPVRFPNGLKGLADYLHGIGIKLGIYLSIGNKTCAGYPGTLGFVEKDAQTLADWHIDMLKFDGCHATLEDLHRDYPAMGIALNKTGRPIVYSCQWPMYAKFLGGRVNYSEVATMCNMFRALTDIYFNYHSVESMIMYIASNPDNMSSYAGPGAWNDPDQLTIGNSGLTEGQEKVQMAMWAIMASPMLLTADLRNVRPSSKKIILNRNVIAISQDPLGVQGVRFLQSGFLSIWQKPVMPAGSLAIALTSTQNAGPPALVEFALNTLPASRRDVVYEVFEVFDWQSLGVYSVDDKFKLRVENTGVVLLKAIPVPFQSSYTNLRGGDL